jgi:Flp pilus assembly protein TadG
VLDARGAPDRSVGGDLGAGVFSTAMGFLVFLLFLFFAMQVMFGLYATSTLRATVHDAAARAAAGRGGTTPAELDRIAGEAEASLGEVGRQPSTVIELELVDEDGDGTGDVVVGRGRAVPPRFVPQALGGMVGFEEITAGARVRVERIR